MRRIVNAAVEAGISLGEGTRRQSPRRAHFGGCRQRGVYVYVFRQEANSGSFVAPKNLVVVCKHRFDDLNIN